MTLVLPSGMAYVPHVRPVFLHHPMKCGGRAVSASVAQACLDHAGVVGTSGPGLHLLANAGDPDIRVGPWTISSSLNDFPFRSSTHYPVRRVPAPEGCIRAAVLRDPLARLVSLFRMYAAEHPRHPWWGLYEESGVPPPPPEWRAFVEQAPPHTLNHMTSMFSESLDPAEAAEAIRALDIWWRAEEMPSGLARLAPLMGLASIPDIRHGEAHPNSPPAAALLADTAVVAAAMEQLAPDIELIRLLGNP